MKYFKIISSLVEKSSAKLTPKMGGLTEEQKRRIEENRQKALQRRAQSAAQKSSSSAGNQPVKQQFAQGPAAGSHQSKGTYNVPPSSNAYKPFTTSKPPSSGTAAVQKSPVKWSVPPHTKEGNAKQQNQQTNASKFGGACTDSSTSSKSFTSIHSTSSSSGFVPYKNSNSKPDAAQGSFQFCSKTNSSSATNLGQKSSNSSSSYQASKSTSNFYSSKPATSSKPSFTSSNYGNKVSTFGQNATKSQQRPWQKSQPFGAGSSSGGMSSAYGGGLTGRCVLESRKRFVVDVTFHAKLIEIFKQMSTKSYGKKF